eukprot:gene11348-12531_t
MASFEVTRQRQQGPKQSKSNKTSLDDPIKKKLHGFLNDLLRFGSLKGFRYFQMYLRGREELVVRVQNEQTCSRNLLGRCESHGFENEGSSDSLPSKKTLPRNSLSGFQFLTIGLPPASPYQTEISPLDPSTTVFLIAAYARYKSPYVWVRSNHERLIKLSECDHAERDIIKDSPLSIKTTNDWATKDVKIWHIVSEIVRLNVIPSPRNPFAIDHGYFDTLGPEECIISTGAIVHFLQSILKEDHSYNSKGLEH